MNTALPAISVDLGASNSTLQWIVDSYVSVKVPPAARAAVGIITMASRLASSIVTRRLFVRMLGHSSIWSHARTFAEASRLLPVPRKDRRASGDRRNLPWSGHVQTAIALT